MILLPWLLHTIWLLSNISSADKMLGINPAFKQSAQICDVDADNLTDGNKHLNLNVKKTDCSEINSVITIILAKNYSISSVTVILGHVPQDASKNAFDKYTVHFRDFKQKCGQFPYNVRDLSQKKRRVLRLNCLYQDQPQDIVLLSADGFPMVLSEVELLSFDTGNGILIPRGCYENFASNKTTPFKNIWACRRFCSEQKLFILAIKNSLCLCDIHYDDTKLLPSSSCNVKCDKKYLCGGDGYSVYLLALQLPVNYQCRHDKDGTAFTVFDGNTDVLCISSCSVSSYALIKQSKCSCRQNLLNVVLRGDVPTCSKPCPGNPDVTCGSEEIPEVYIMCQGDFKLLSCYRLLKCLDDAMDGYGVCVEGCKEGFVGPHCIEAATVRGQSSIKSHPASIDNVGAVTGFGSTYSVEDHKGGTTGRKRKISVSDSLLVEAISKFTRRSVSYFCSHAYVLTLLFN